MYKTLRLAGAFHFCGMHALPSEDGDSGVIDCSGLEHLYTIARRRCAADGSPRQQALAAISCSSLRRGVSGPREYRIGGTADDARAWFFKRRVRVRRRHFLFGLHAAGNPRRASRGSMERAQMDFTNLAELGISSVRNRPDSFHAAILLAAISPWLGGGRISSRHSGLHQPLVSP